MTRGRIGFAGTSMAWNVRPGSPPAFVPGRGWVPPLSLRPGDRVSRHDPARPGSCYEVASVSPGCPSCRGVLGADPSCPDCVVGGVMKS